MCVHVFNQSPFSLKFLFTLRAREGSDVRVRFLMSFDLGLTVEQGSTFFTGKGLFRVLLNDMNI